MPEEEQSAAAATEEPDPPPLPPRRAAAPKKRKGKPLLAIGWLVLLIFIIGLGAGVWFGREQIVAQIPQAETLYGLLGIPIGDSGPTLELRVAAPTSTLRQGARVIVVSGSVTNLTERKQPVPKLRARLTDKDGAVLLEWEFEAPKAELDAGAAVDFSTETIDPPREGQHLTINFVKDEE